jgi:hypothetical protein
VDVWRHVSLYFHFLRQLLHYSVQLRILRISHELYPWWCATIIQFRTTYTVCLKNCGIMDHIKSKIYFIWSVSFRNRHSIQHECVKRFLEISAVRNCFENLVTVVRLVGTSSKRILFIEILNLKNRKKVVAEN